MSDNKVHKLAVCLPWQQWAETSVWFNGFGISAFHSYVVFDLRQSLSEWRLLVSECVLVCCCKNVVTNTKFGKSGNEIREMLVQFCRDNAMEKTAVYKWVTCFSEGRESVTDKERSGRPATSRTEETLAKARQHLCENHRLTVRGIAE
jgi:hypothetical protein